MSNPVTAGDNAALERAASLIGQVISKRYRIDEILAMGGMGAVYLGEHILMHKRVAIKILHPDAESLPELVKRFEREAIAGAHIQHPNVAVATDFGETDDGSYFLVLEYVRGKTLHEIIKRGPLPFERASRIARQLAAALEATHAMDMVHRDVKPRNIMVAEGLGDLVKLIDFGLAKIRVDRLSALAAEAERAERTSLPERLTGTGVVFGTIAYLAPEAALGMDAVDARADLYALGLIFYEMLAGRHPFLATDPYELFTQQRSVPPPRFAQHAPGIFVPPPIESVVRHLLEKQPTARYQSAAEFMAALDEALLAAANLASQPADIVEPELADAELLDAELADAQPADQRSSSAAPTSQVAEQTSDKAEAEQASDVAQANSERAEAKSAVEEASAREDDTAERQEPKSDAVEKASAREDDTAEPQETKSDAVEKASAREDDTAERQEAKSDAVEEASARAEDTSERQEAKSDAAKAALQRMSEPDFEASRPAFAPGSELPLDPVPKKKRSKAKHKPPPPKGLPRWVGTWLVLGAMGAVFLILAPEPPAPPAPTHPTPPAVSSPPAAPATSPTEVLPPQPMAVVSTAPDTTTSAQPSAEPPDSGLSKQAFLDAVEARKWNDAADALVTLIQKDATALQDRALARSARDVLVAIATSGGDRVDRAYQAVATHTGTDGPDILYELIETRGRSSPALRAVDLLRKPDVAAHASPDVRIAFQLRDAPCDKKLDLLDRAVAEGEKRALLALEGHVRPCFKQSRPVADAIRQLKDKLKQNPK